VGDRNPPAEFRFRPGHVAFRATGKRGQPSLTARLKQLLTEPYPRSPSGKKLKRGHRQLYADKLVEVLCQMAARGEFQHLNMVFDRVEGRVPIAFRNTSEQPPAITFNFSVASPPGNGLPPKKVNFKPLPSGEEMRRLDAGLPPHEEPDHAG